MHECQFSLNFQQFQLSTIAFRRVVLICIGVSVNLVKEHFYDVSLINSKTVNKPMSELFSTYHLLFVFGDKI